MVTLHCYIILERFFLPELIWCVCRCSKYYSKIVYEIFILNQILKIEILAGFYRRIYIVFMQCLG